MKGLIEVLDYNTIDLDVFTPNKEGRIVLECIKDSSESVIIRQKQDHTTQKSVILSETKDRVETHSTRQTEQNPNHPDFVLGSNLRGVTTKPIYLKTAKPDTKVIINLEAETQVKFFWIQFIASEKRELTINLLEPNIRVELYGLTHLKNIQIAENRLQINHLAADCQSFTLFKTVLDDSAQAKFFGKIFVAAKAHNTDAKLSNHNILLSDSAEVESKPELEIYCDDVKCTHGATIGHFSPDQEFYLQSRGVLLPERQAILTEAFFTDLIGKIEA